ncbi:MAG: hypothetical protein PT977_01375 [Acidobacteriota bacterium]|nr:hypothetical protein [Acidobacteriota bacterium]
MRIRALALAAALLLLPSKKIFSSSSSSSAQAPVGLWHAALVPSEGHEVFFDLKITAKGSRLSAALVNDRVEFAFTSASWDGKKLTLELANYDARLVAELKGDRLEGGYTRVVAAGLAEVPFRASRKPRAPVSPPKAGNPVASLDGSWGVEMLDGKKTEKLTGIFRQSGSAVTGRAAAGRHARGRVPLAHESARALARKAVGRGLPGDFPAGLLRHREAARSRGALRRVLSRRRGPRRLDGGRPLRG